MAVARIIAMSTVLADITASVGLPLSAPAFLGIRSLLWVIQKLEDASYYSTMFPGSLNRG